MFVGTFLENYEDILEILDKFVGENGREDADVNCQEKLVVGNEIKEKDSGSEEKVDIQYKPFARKGFQDLTMLAVYLIQIILAAGLNIKKPSCASSRKSL